MIDEDYASLVALCQVIPGPTSSQLGMGLGFNLGGIKGAIAAWSGFTLAGIRIQVFGGFESRVERTWANSGRI